MPVTTTTCIVVKCGECGDGWQHDDEYGTPHFDSIEDARKALLGNADDGDNLGWTVTGWGDGARWLDRYCAAKVACEAAGGHQWGEWRGCLCNRAVDHGTGLTKQFRYCERSDYCGAREERTVEGECDYRPPFPEQSRGAVLIQHRRNHEIFAAALPDYAAASQPHEVPAGVEQLVAEGAAIAARIDAALPDDYAVR